MQAPHPCQPAKSGRKPSFSAKKLAKRCTNAAMMRRDRLQADLHRLAALCGALVVAACATAPHRPAPPPPPAAPASVPPPQARQRSGDAKFDAFLAQARTDALAQGITAASFDSATAGIAPIPSIIAMNANQPEFSRPVWSYLDSAVSARRIADGQFMLTRYREVLGGRIRPNPVHAHHLSQICRRWR